MPRARPRKVARYGDQFEATGGRLSSLPGASPGSPHLYLDPHALEQTPLGPVEFVQLLRLGQLRAAGEARGVEHGPAGLGAQERRAPIVRQFRPALAFLGHFDDAIVRIDLDPIAGFYDLQRIPIEIGYGRGVGDDRA